MARPSLYADDLPVFALEDLAHGALENLAIGRGNVESKWVVAPGDDLSPDLETRGGRQALEKIAVSVLNCPDSTHWLETALHRGCYAAQQLANRIVQSNMLLCGATISSYGVAGVRPNWPVGQFGSAWCPAAKSG